MNLHEYQAKQLFSDYGIPIPEGRSATTAKEARQAAATLGGKLWVVKAQVHAGGRGKAGGVKLVKSADEVEEAASALLGSTLTTHQTGPRGLPINAVLVETGSEIERELYLSALVDRSRERIVFMASPAGGMDIEEVAANTPEKIFRVAIDPACGVQPYEIRLLGFGLGLSKDQLKPFGRIVQGIYDLFVGSDASLVEINPLIVTKAGDVMALDAKVNLDDNALFRHQALAELRDETQEDEVENEASRFGLSYVSLDGDIACMVNGAGLAMATMDIIKLEGGAPANFLDVGGGATTERVTAAFKLILANEDVKAILVNIFGGIVRCDLIAEGIIAAVKEVDVSVPVVVRLEGTNVEKGKQLLAESDVDIITANDLTDGAKKVVAEAQR